MPVEQLLNVSRIDRNHRTSITLVGEIDLESAPLLRDALRQCLQDGIRTIDVDLTHVTFCDCSGLNAFLDASQHTAAAGGRLRLHDPPAMTVRLFALTGSGFLLLGLPVLPRPVPYYEEYEAGHRLDPFVSAALGGAL
ncbi:MAG: anti-sigma factor antagonist [Streptomyces sp.]|jgi:anti-anti-sigma factor|nr:anti-sigma factor antagonist [Streptomyces sp.]MDX6350446.1 anti-sigma factor antagonist [Streptomyces sp.]